MSDESVQDFPAMKCAVCGWFVNKDKHVIRIFAMVVNDGDKTILVIPTGSIKSVQIVDYKRG